MPTTAEAHHLTCLGYPTTIDGTKGPDDIRGTSGRDVVAALGDDDVFADVPSPYDPDHLNDGDDIRLPRLGK